MIVNFIIIGLLLYRFLKTYWILRQTSDQNSTVVASFDATGNVKKGLYRSCVIGIRIKF
jgi:hypothetical protein